MKNYSLNKAGALILIGGLSGLIASGNAMLSTSVTALAGRGVNCNATGTSSAGCNVSFSGKTFLENFPYSGSIGGNAFASYNGLFAGTLFSATPTADIGSYATATAASLDTLTVLGGSGTGYIRFLYDGFITSISWLDQTFTFQDDSNPVESYDCCFMANVINHPFFYQTLLYPFTFGVPFTITVSANAFELGTVGDNSGRGSVEVNFVDLNIFDQNQSPDENAYVVSDSGTNYATPEPTSFVLLGTLLGASACLRFRKRSRA
jgi:hypothetical protein